MKTKLLVLLAGTTLAISPAMAQREVNAANANPQDAMVRADAARGRDKAEDTAPEIEPIAAQAMYNFAGCVVELNSAGATKLLAKDYRSKEYQDDIRKISKGHDRCITPGGRLSFGGLIFAGNLAEHLLTGKFTGPALATELGRDRTATPIAARSTTEAISLCVVMRAPGESAALFRTEVMSDAEKVAMQALAPQLSGCIKEGTQFRTNRPGLRALLALASYRLAVTSADGAAG
ncbi:hypothetical protein [Sphingopyxis sp.]|uniref:hypothetical protein n=1 Tax=Sphingopyxis sp. TaxID=1908224 RepID=UPI003D10DAFD